MPTLRFKGRETIWNHHLGVPYHALEAVEELGYRPEAGAGHVVVEGDNLLALKALLPQYAHKVGCIYIDPPYNTGNEGWAYNDRVNSPMIKDWLHKTVDREDLTRHDKWLCMMVPRLQLLKELLRDDGVLIVSIDDHEVHYLGVVMKELFGEDQVEVMIWEKVGDGSAGAGKMKVTKRFRVEHEYLIVAYKDKKRVVFNRYMDYPHFKKYDGNPDKDPRGVYKRGNMCQTEEKSNTNHKNYYTVASPSGERYTRQWHFGKEKFNALDAQGRIYWGPDGGTFPRLKIFKDEKKETTPTSILLERGSATMGNREVDEVFGARVFDNPKPTKLLRHLLSVATDKNTIILDSFAGSGSTLHAVMALNQEDGGQRRCVVVQMTEATPQHPDKNACRDITRERIRRVIEQNGYESGFAYVRIGASLDPEAMLSGILPSYEKLAAHVFYLATGTRLRQSVNESTYYVGAHKNCVVYLFYAQNTEALTRLALTQEAAEQIAKKHPGKRKVVYAPACFLDGEYREEQRIDYVPLPYGLLRNEAHHSEGSFS